MDTTIESLLETYNPSRSPLSRDSTLQILQWIQKLALMAGVGGLVFYFMAQPQSMWVLPSTFGLLTISALIRFSLRWRELKRAASRQDWRRYEGLQDVIQRFDDGFDVLSPITPSIVVNGQTLVVLRAWSASTGKATLLLDQNGRVINDPDIWRQSVLLIEFANACLPGVARNRRVIINTNQYARNLAAKAWRKALTTNKDAFNHLGLAAELQILIEQWATLETFLSLRIALFQAEEKVVEQVTVPSSGQEEIEGWFSAQEGIFQAMRSLDLTAEKISSASARLLTGWLENKSVLDWDRPDELEAGLKFAYLFQSLLKRTLIRWNELQQPNLKTFQHGIDLARETGLMIAHSE
jgi:hypothetical protein